MRQLLLLIVLVTLAGCQGSGRDVRNGEQVFQALITDPIPAGTTDIASTGYLTDGDGHDIYLRFVVTESYLPALIALRHYEPIECESDFVQGNMTLPQGLESHIPEWAPFSTSGILCFASGRSFENAWTLGARGILVVHPESLTVYYNEIGL